MVNVYSAYLTRCRLCHKQKALCSQTLGLLFAHGGVPKTEHPREDQEESDRATYKQKDSAKVRDRFRCCGLFYAICYHGNRAGINRNELGSHGNAQEKHAQDQAHDPNRGKRKQKTSFGHAFA